MIFVILAILNCALKVYEKLVKSSIRKMFFFSMIQFGRKLHFPGLFIFSQFFDGILKSYLHL